MCGIIHAEARRDALLNIGIISNVDIIDIIISEDGALRCVIKHINYINN